VSIDCGCELVGQRVDECEDLRAATVRDTDKSCSLPTFVPSAWLRIPLVP
jgi:hypothetical protein